MQREARRLEIGSWRLEAGDWRGSRLKARDWMIVFGELRLDASGWGDERSDLGIREKLEVGRSMSSVAFLAAATGR